MVGESEERIEKLEKENEKNKIILGTLIGWLYRELGERSVKQLHDMLYRGWLQHVDKTSAIASNDRASPVFIGVDLAKGSDTTVIRCGACGWCGEPKDIDRDKDGMTSCPDCKIQWVNRV